MTETEIICPKCGWQPDGRAHWTCECGHSWNTFETRGKCPECGKQWADTWCLRCGGPSLHETWYRAKGTIPPLPLKNEAELLSRKVKIEKKLLQYGITDTKITYLPYLEFSEDDFQPTYEVGCRILVLWAVAYLAHDLSQVDEVAEWLTQTGLWERVSENEMKMFSGAPDERTVISASWQIEGMSVLSWAVNLLDELPDLDKEMSQEATDMLFDGLPLFEDPTVFLNNLSFRNKEDIFIENIVNELITHHLRNQQVSGEKIQLHIDSGASYERHRALNWLRCFGGISDWDDTDTST